MARCRGLGVGYGANAAVTPSVAAKFGIEGLGRLLGWLYTSFGVASMIGGPPLACALIDLTGDYHCSAYVAVVGGIVSLAAIVPLREGRPPVESVAAD